MTGKLILNNLHRTVFNLLSERSKKGNAHIGRKSVIEEFDSLMEFRAILRRVSVNFGTTDRHYCD